MIKDKEDSFELTLIMGALIIVTIFMSKLSVQPDTSPSKGLKPTAFPMTNISQFSISQSSIHSNSPSRTFPDHSDVKFQSTTISKLPNLFHYNDRTKLTFSSDEEDNFSPISVQKPISLAQSVKQKCIREQAQRDEIEKRNRQIERIKQELRKQKQAEQRVRQQQAAIQREKSLKKLKITEGQVNIKILQEQKTNKHNGRSKKLNVESKTFSKTIKMDIDLEDDENHNSSVEQISIHETPTNSKIIEQKISTHPSPSSRMQMDTSSLEIIEGVPALKHLQQLVDRKIPAQASIIQSKEEQAPVTPTRRKRHRIFDQSSKRNYNYINTEREKTPRAVQTEQKLKKEDESSFSNGRNYSNTPQVKALNILDKLVDQIGNNNTTCLSMKCEEPIDNSFYKRLSQFNQACLEELTEVQNIRSISTLRESDLQNQLSNLFERSLKWRQSINGEILNLSFSNTIEYEIVKKFKKLNQGTETYSKLASDYSQTVERLEQVQQKMEQYVLIMQNKDSKGLYRLMNWLNTELERMKQLKVGCGKSRPQRMFSEYLRREISQLEQIKQDIDDNFMGDFPKLLY